MATKKTANTPVETVESAEVVGETAPAEPVEAAQVPAVETPAVQPETPVVAEAAPAPVHEVIVVDAPVAPRKKGNRGLGVALALAAALVYAALLIAAAFVLSLFVGGGTAFISDAKFYFPVLFFFVGLVIVTLILNRAGWWSHMIGSVVVALITWLGTASLVLVAEGMFSMNQSEANATFWAAAFSPIVIIAALLAREVSIWTGAILARRGRSLRVRNAEAQEAFEREQAELIPTV